ncbi:hypothetical protein GCM10011383_40960 [Hymenobacter cavernae]|uniref:Magnesium transporter MgtE intracellular domain-containing protein n=1 Tax=Hymenobacter cavernae TaxID=2044852 RepID=A0ABQ1UU75_9BACT|nr:hypothetical protein GCM10011383_40960 [Hymenobacter cavernae]
MDDHPRRPQPLAPPPDGYFDRLPTQIMARVQPGASQEPAAFGWLKALSLPLRTALGSVVVLGGFAATFLLNQPTNTPHLVHANLASVPRAEMVQYLLASDERVSLSDLSELPVADQDMVHEYLNVSPAEVQAALDEQPTEPSYL